MDDDGVRPSGWAFSSHAGSATSDVEEIDRNWTLPATFPLA